MVATIELPFKPFTLDEVQAVSGVRPQVLDTWTAMLAQPPTLSIKSGCGAVGLDWMGCFAVFVGARFLEEGAPGSRSTDTVRYLAATSLEYLEANLKAGRNFPVPRAMVDGFTGDADGMMVPAPDTTLGNRLRLDRLLAEFKDRLAKAFPDYKG